MQEFLDVYRFYNAELIASFRGASESLVERFERSLAVELPSDYRDFLLTMAGGSDHPDSRHVDESVVLFRAGRRHISFALERIITQRTTMMQSERNRFTDWVRIGAEDGSTGSDPYMYVADGRVVQAVRPQHIDERFEVPWFSSFREMLFALGFYGLARPGQEITFQALNRDEDGQPQSLDSANRFRGLDWERDALRQIAKDARLELSEDVPAPSLGFHNDTTSILFSNLFLTPIGSPSYELRLTSSDSAALAQLVPLLEQWLIARALQPVR